MALLGSVSANANWSPATVNTSGAELIVVAVYSLGTPATAVTDNKGNTFTMLTGDVTPGVSGVFGSSICGRLAYCLNPTAGSGHDITASGGGGAAGMDVMWFDDAVTAIYGSGTRGTVAAPGTTVQAGAINPGGDALHVAAGFAGYGGGGTDPSINSGFTQPVLQNGLAGHEHGFAYKRSTTSENPTWTAATGGYGTGMIALAAAFTGPSAPTITTTSLPGGPVGTAYSQTLGVTGGSGSITWSLSGGSLPTGLSLNSSTGQITGTPTALGVYGFTVRATDAAAAFDEQGLSITISAALFSTNWPRIGIVPRGGLLAWHSADGIAGLADGQSITTVPDLSGNGRTLAVAGNQPVYRTNIINGYPAAYFNGGRDPLVYSGALTPKHIFVVAAYEDAAFPSGEAGYAGLLGSASSGESPLVGQPSSTRFFDFDFETGGGYAYRRRDVAFPENDLQAAFGNQIAIFEISRASGFAMDGIQVGRHVGNASRLWKGYWCEQLLYDRVLAEGERFTIYTYLAMKYRIWPQIASGLDVFPFAAQKSSTMEREQENYLSDPYSGPKKALVRGGYAETYGVQYSIRLQEEIKAAKAFHAEKGKTTRFVFRDYRFYPPEDRTVTFTGPFRDQGSEVTFRFNYGFEIAEQS